MVQRLLFFVLTILVVKRISSLPLRLLVAAPFVLLTAADMSISLYSWCTFGTTFNDGFAISVLQSDPDEVVKMLGMWGCGRFPGLLYHSSPHCWRYILGLTAPSDNFIRRSLYHLM